MKIQPGVPTGTSGYMEAEIEKALSDFAGEDFTAQVLERVTGQLGDRLGWKPAGEGAGVDAVMQIRVENICFCAPDALSEVEVKLVIKVVITESGSGDLLLRDCLDWTFAGVYTSLQDLARADAARREELLSDLATRLLDRLAEHLATRVSKG